MNERTVDVRDAGSEAEVLERFFAATSGVVPDYGGRNLDALIDVLGAVSEPLTITLEGAHEAAYRLDPWFDKFLGCLALCTPRITFVLRADKRQ